MLGRGEADPQLGGCNSEALINPPEVPTRKSGAKLARGIIPAPGISFSGDGACRALCHLDLPLGDFPNSWGRGRGGSSFSGATTLSALRLSPVFRHVLVFSPQKLGRKSPFCKVIEILGFSRKMRRTNRQTSHIKKIHSGC